MGDIKHLLKLVLENDDALDPQGTPNGQLSDTKQELITQVKENINQLVNDEGVGSIVALFIFLLTDKASELEMRRIGGQYEEYLKGGGKETDFTSAVTQVLRPLTENFVAALVNALKKYRDNTGKGHQDVWEQTLREYKNKNKNIHREAQKYSDLKASSTKAKLQTNALNRINKMSGDANIVRVFSMFLLYLTDKQTVSDLKTLGATYGAKLNNLIDTNDVNWTKDLIEQLLNKFTPLIATMAKAVSKQIKTVANPKGPKEAAQQFQQDKSKAEAMVKKYSL